MKAPSMWSKEDPNLQLAWDATSLAALMFCPRFYEYTILKGYRGSSIDLEFGILTHEALETFWKARLAGKTRDEAELEALRVAVFNSGVYIQPEEPAIGPIWVPWGGTYEQQWHCTGTVPYRNEKGNRAICPWAHKGKWFPLPAPGTCSCGSPTEERRNWVPQNPVKDRHALVRLVAAYCEAQPEALDEGLAPYSFPNGTPAVELPFRIPLPFKTPGGENYLLVGYLDRIAHQGDEFFIPDVKTTKATLGKAFFDRYSPNVQMDTYDLAASLIFPELDFTGPVVEGAQVLQGGVRLGHQILRRSEEQREEWLQDIGDWLNIAEYYAANKKWTMNRRSCAMCQFKGICSMKPESRDLYLENNFNKRPWNPLEER